MSQVQEETQPMNQVEDNTASWGWGSISLACLGVTCLLMFVGVVFFRVFWITNVENYQLGFVFDRWTGKIEQVEKTGWVIRMPFRNAVHRIDLRPYQVTISANQRVLNAKLVRFNPDGLDEFVEWHGRDAGDSTRDLLEILKCYAFDVEGGKGCPFLEVINEIAPSQLGRQTPSRIKFEEDK